MRALDEWHRFVETGDPAILHDLLDPGAIFESPVVHMPQRGRAITAQYLVGAVQILGGSHFRYTGEWLSDSGAVLEFQTEIDGIEINGVDIITTSSDGRRINHFKVMIRPLKAIEIVHRRMGEMLARNNPVGGT
nr:nuclear transport factor 2 family protein [uncultured Sphingomonas sp.]